MLRLLLCTLLMLSGCSTAQSAPADEIVKARLQFSSILDAIAGRLSPAVVPIPAPPGAVEVPTLESTRAAANILSAYKGRRWYVVGRRGDRSHLLKHMGGHGLEPDGLEPYSYSDLERIHGAFHERHHSAVPYAKKASVRGFRRVRVRACPNGRCNIRRK